MNLATISEAGLPGYEMSFWFAAYVPAKTPPAIVARLNTLLVNAVKGAATRSLFESTGLVGFTTTPEELARFQQAESQKWARIIKSAGIEPE